MNLIGTDDIALFDLWDLPINSFSNQVNTVTTSNITATEKLKTEFKKFLEIFSESFETCAEAIFKVKENATPVFRPNRSNQ